MDMEYMHDLKDKLCKELEEIARKPEMSAGDLEAVHKLTDTIKNLDKIEMLEDGGYSRDGDWEMEGRGSYERGASYRGRKRDSMGRYSRDGRSMGRYSRDGRYGPTTRMYSRAEAKDDMMAKLEDMMGSASEQERAILRQAMDKLEKV